jgi:hypothetical protein
MDRFLLTDESRALQHLPQQNDVSDFFKSVMYQDQAAFAREVEIDNLLTSTRKTADLQRILFESTTHPLASKYSLEELQMAVKRNMGSLLHSRWGFRKDKHFYRVLQDYVATYKLEITHLEQHYMDKNALGFFARLFHKSRDWGMYKHHVDYSNFSLKEVPPSWLEAGAAKN